MFHFHRYMELRKEWRPCKNPVFEQMFIIRQCVHCMKLDEYKLDQYRQAGTLDKV